MNLNGTPARVKYSIAAPRKIPQLRRLTDWFRTCHMGFCYGRVDIHRARSTRSEFAWSFRGRTCKTAQRSLTRALKGANSRYVEINNATHKPFGWSKTTGDVLLTSQRTRRTPKGAHAAPVNNSEPKPGQIASVRSAQCRTSRERSLRPMKQRSTSRTEWPLPG